MPIDIKKAPKVLPDSAKSIFVEAFNSALENSCSENSDKDACASRIAWGAVKKSFRKDESGNWVRKMLAPVSLSMYITKASVGEEGVLNWSGVVSDTQTDSYQTEMSEPLFTKFIERAESGEPVLEEFRSAAILGEYWTGGQPYVSLAHYPDLDGEGVPGKTTSIYMDGEKLKAKGEFFDTPLGQACFKSIVEDSENLVPPEERVRFSIGFLDYAHEHLSDGTIFERKSSKDICVQCILESLFESGQGIRYLDGHLIHLALTRIPVNTRTEIEVNMTTRKEDAASIVPLSLVEKLEELLDGETIEQSLVTKSDEVVPLLHEIVQALKEKSEVIPVEETEPHVLQSAVDKLLSDFDEMDPKDPNNSLEKFQPSFEQFGRAIQEKIGVSLEPSEVVESSEADTEDSVILQEIRAIRSDLAGQLEGIASRVTQLEERRTLRLPSLNSRNLQSQSNPVATNPSGQPVQPTSPAQSQDEGDYFKKLARKTTY